MLSWLAESELEPLLTLRCMAAMGSRVCQSSSARGNSGRGRWRPSLGNLEAMDADSSQGGGREMSSGK